MLAFRFVPGKAACEGRRKTWDSFTRNRHLENSFGSYWREKSRQIDLNSNKHRAANFTSRGDFVDHVFKGATNPDPSFSEENLQGVKWAPRAVKDIDWLLSGNNILCPKAVESVPLGADTQYNLQFSFTSIFAPWQSISSITISNAINIFVVY